MQLQKTEVTLKILEETGIAKTLKFLSDYCELYKEEIPALDAIHKNIQALLVKWKNYVNKHLFEDKNCHFEDFQKEKYKLKVQKLNKKGSRSKLQAPVVMNEGTSDEK